jgi:hypothetical protein
MLIGKDYDPNKNKKPKGEVAKGDGRIQVYEVVDQEAWEKRQ